MSDAIDKSESHALTSARIALGLTGPAIPTREHLRFQLDHALARDAVHAQLGLSALRHALDDRDLSNLTVTSAAQQKHNRATYLRRPDLGRTLSPESRPLLEQHATANLPSPNLVLILADGLSALALDRHAILLLDELLPKLDGPKPTIVTATAARVALGDEIGHILGAQIAVVFIGERPGLSSPDSLGVYITWNPRPGRTDADRNCISNIRAEGLSYKAAAARILFYLSEAHRLQTTGVSLKDSSPNVFLDPI